MPGREDFAIIRARLLTDPRAHQAAALYVGARIAMRKTALATVLGHVSMLGVWAARETDDGRLPCDATVTVSFCTLCDHRTAQKIIACLTEAGLLKVDGDPPSPRLAGFKECYDPVLYARERNRRNARSKRARDADVSASVSGDVSAYVSGGVSVLRTDPVRPTDRNEGLVADAPPEPEGRRPLPSEIQTLVDAYLSAPSDSERGYHATRLRAKGVSGTAIADLRAQVAARAASNGHKED